LAQSLIAEEDRNKEISLDVQVRDCPETKIFEKHDVKQGKGEPAEQGYQ
jgi:hypothetical protein